MPIQIPPTSGGGGGGGGGSGVTSFNTRVGPVVPFAADYSSFYASLTSPALTGVPTTPTASPGTNTTQIASTAYADAAVAVETARATGIEALKAPLASPALIGIPTSTTPAVDDSSTKIATTAYVLGQVSGTNPAANGTAAPGTSARFARSDHIHPTDATRAPLASPALTGTPTAPTAAVDDSTTKLATTAWVLGQAASSSPAIDGTAATGTSTRFARADHVHPTDTTRAPLISPALSGTPTVPTATLGTNTTQAASTAFVQAGLTALSGSWILTSAEGVAGGVATLDGAGQVPASQLGNAPGGGGSALGPNTQFNVFQFGPLGTAAQDGHYVKTNSAVQHVGDGSGTTLQSVFGTGAPGLAAAVAVYPFATALTQTVDFCAIQAGLNQLGVFDHGTLHVPIGFYKMGNPNTATLQFPGTSGQGLVALVGDNPFYAWPGYAAATVLDWSTSGDVTGQPPHFVYAIDATPSNRAAIVGIAMKGPLSFATNGGVLPCALAGIRVAGQSLVEKVGVETFSTGVGYGGGTSGGFTADKSFDHSTIRDLWTDNVGYGIHLLPGSITSGDQHFYNIEVNSMLAGMAIAASASSGFSGSTITGGALYGGVGVYLYDDGSTGQQGLQFSGNVITGVSFELCFNSAVYSQLYKLSGAPNAHGIVSKNTWAYLPQIQFPDLNGWGNDNVIQSSGGSGSPSITVVDGQGFVFQVGMTATGLFVPANTTITAIAGSWPWTTATLTLSHNLTGDPSAAGTTLSSGISGSLFSIPINSPAVGFPAGTNVIVTSGAHSQLLTTTSTVTTSSTSFTVIPTTANFAYPSGSAVQPSLNVVQPKLGNIIANTISNNVFPSFGGQRRNLPIYVAGPGGAFNNVCSDVDTTAAAARTAVMTSGPSWGNTWGQPGSTCFIGSSQMTAGQTCAAGDMLMWDAGNKTVKKADGSRPLAGAAILAAASGANVDFYMEAMSPNNATVRNYSSTLIAANALLKFDLANPGGVTTATNLTDVPIVGGNDNTTIAATGGTGTVDYFKVS